MCAAKESSKKKTRVVEGYLKECSVSLGLREMDIQTAMRYNRKLMRWTIIKEKRELEKGLGLRTLAVQV